MSREVFYQAEPLKANGHMDIFKLTKHYSEGREVGFQTNNLKATPSLFID